jgi:hypothetical protein
MDHRTPVPERAFHAGEQALQARLGLRERMAAVGNVVMRDHMPDQHRSFFAQLPFLVVGSVDAGGQPWASVLAAPPGFVASPDDKTLSVRALPLVDDPLHANLRVGASIGLLGIEPHTRRRNRMNGLVTAHDGQSFVVQVEQSFGNCPKYIQAREPLYMAPNTGAALSVHRAQGLDAGARQMLAQTDTFFIATAYEGADPAQRGPAHGVDVSHRGGKPGFVRVEGDTLTVPDFMGNFFFNTLGNLAVNPRAGLLVVDYATDDMLYLAAEAQIVWDGPLLASFAGAQRLLARRSPACCASPLRCRCAGVRPSCRPRWRTQDAGPTEPGRIIGG